LRDGQLTIVDTTAWPGGEIAPAQIAGERQKASRFGSADLGCAPRATPIAGSSPPCAPTAGATRRSRRPTPR
jgi:hypothetical protein